MTMLKPMKYNNTYALAVKRDFAKNIIYNQLVIYVKYKVNLNQGLLWNLKIEMMVIKQ